jgi:signal transduction histidine kinase
VNRDLFQWAMENLVKNAMDAIKSSTTKAQVSVKLHRVENEVVIDVKDTGVGIEKKYHSEIFNPGYSTKKRGWGLGLSLTQRIIEEYHKGKLVLKESELGTGTTIRVLLKVDAEISDNNQSERAAS